MPIKPAEQRAISMYLNEQTKVINALPQGEKAQAIAFVMNHIQGLYGDKGLDYAKTTDFFKDRNISQLGKPKENSTYVSSQTSPKIESKRQEDPSDPVIAGIYAKHGFVGFERYENRPNEYDAWMPRMAATHAAQFSNALSELNAQRKQLPKNGKDTSSVDKEIQCLENLLKIPGIQQEYDQLMQQQTNKTSGLFAKCCSFLWGHSKSE